MSILATLAIITMSIWAVLGMMLLLKELFGEEVQKVKIVEEEKE